MYQAWGMEETFAKISPIVCTHCFAGQSMFTCKLLFSHILYILFTCTLKKSKSLSPQSSSVCTIPLTGACDIHDRQCHQPLLFTGNELLLDITTPSPGISFQIVQQNRKFLFPVIPGVMPLAWQHGSASQASSTFVHPEVSRQLSNWLLWKPVQTICPTAINLNGHFLFLTP